MSDPASPAHRLLGEVLDAALAENVNAVAYGPGTDDCVARSIVERIGGDELRALGWTPEIMQAAGLSPFIELESQQFHVLDSALVDCVDAVDLALQSVGVSAHKVSWLWTTIAPWYEPGETGVQVSSVDQVCIVDWLGRRAARDGSDGI